MKRNPPLPISKVYHVYLTLILSVFLFYSCQDSLNSMSSNAQGETTLNTTSTVASQKSKGLSMEVSDNTGSEFKVFDATGFKNKPDMSQFGIRPIHIMYPHDLWDTPRNENNKWEFPAQSAIARELQKAEKLKSHTVVVDARWPTKGDDETVQKGSFRYKELYYDLKKIAPNTVFGYFNTLPIKNYWTKGPSQETLKSWKSRNNRLKFLAQKVDAFFLPAYTRNKDQDQWVTNMKYLIEEARRIGNDQPVYLFLWPQYNARGKSFHKKYIEKDFWRLQLETAKKYADGIVFYAPHGTPWDGSAPWWDVTKKFMEDLGEYQPESKVPDSEFKVFDGTRFRNKPEMTQYGFTPIEGIYHVNIWDKPMNQVGKWELPSKELVNEWAEKASNTNSQIAMINIERWPNKGSNVDRSVEKLSTVYDWFKQAQPNMKFGYYNMVPYKLHWNRYPQVKWISRLTEKNNRLSPLANKVDVYFPSAYTKSKDKKGWVINTKYMIKQAHKYNGDKPVYLFLWPQYHTPDKPGLDRNYIGEEFWKLQLETARKYADGVVIWFPYSTKWSEASAAPWWEVTKKFLRDMGKGG